MGVRLKLVEIIGTKSGLFSLFKLLDIWTSELLRFYLVSEDSIYWELCKTGVVQNSIDHLIHIRKITQGWNNDTLRSYGLTILPEQVLLWASGLGRPACYLYTRTNINVVESINNN